MIVVDPRRTPTAAVADLHLPVRPGGDLAAAERDARRDRAEGLVDRGFVERHTEGFDEALAAAARVAAGARRGGVRRAGRATSPPPRAASARARRAMALWSMGANQSTVGTLKNRALINLCLATGNIGRPGTGPLSLTGQPNAMGGREAGGLAHLLPGYRKVADAGATAPRCGGCGTCPPRAGHLAARRAGGDGSVRGARGRRASRRSGSSRPTRSCRSPTPRASRPRCAAPSSSSCQDAYHPTETSALAHVVLPAAQWAEKEGTMTNSERRVSLVRKALDPPGDALPDWEIFARLGRALGHGDAVRVARRGGGLRRVRRADRGPAVRPERPLARAPAARGGAAVADARRAAPAATTPRHRAPLRERPLPDRRRPRAAGRRRRTPSRPTRPTRELPARADDRPRRAPVAHDDAHRQVPSDLLAAEPEPFVELHAERRARGRGRATASWCSSLAPRPRHMRARVERHGRRRASRSRRSTGARCTSSRARARSTRSSPRRSTRPRAQPELKATRGAGRAAAPTRVARRDAAPSEAAPAPRRRRRRHGRDGDGRSGCSRTAPATGR